MARTLGLATAGLQMMRGMMLGRARETLGADFDRLGRYGVGETMHLSRVVVRGFRASAEADLECTFPGRFSVLVGANSSGKTTVSDALYLGHIPHVPAATSTAVCHSGDRSTCRRG